MGCRAGKRPARSERCLQGQAAELANGATGAAFGLETFSMPHRPATLTSPTVSDNLWINMPQDLPWQLAKRRALQKEPL